MYIITFFIYCSGAHRDLHSFPTRRSSDLVTLNATMPATNTARAILNSTVDFGLPCPAVIAPPVPYRRLPCGSCSDRKSTRLNSSHVEISYAVFCLKKKKPSRADQYRQIIL